MKVYVLDRNRHPLMPCEPVIARLLLKSGKAKVFRRTPFTIKLTYEPETTYTQECVVGIDTGSGTVGSSAVTEDGKVLYLSEVEVRNDIKTKMDDRRKYRKNRRNRKTRYRKPRFLNRRNSKKKGRFSPTMHSKIHAHEKEIRFIRSLLPVKKNNWLILETGTFDTQYMKNPRIRSKSVIHWGYQRGRNYGFANTKAFVLARDGYTCRHCKGKHKDTRLEVHHIVWRSQGGSDDADNLITLCRTCHTGVHDGTVRLGASGLKKGTLSFATQMNSIRIQLLKNHPEAVETFGYITKENRQALGLEKDHYVDAAVIASGGKKLTFVTDTVIRKRCVPDGDFARSRGVRSEERIPKGKICGFLRYDKVRYLGKEYFIKGRMTSGYAILMDIRGKKADFSGAPRGWKTPKLGRCRRISARKTWMITEEALIPSIA